MTKKDINETQDQAQIEAEVLEAAEVKDDSRNP